MNAWVNLAIIIGLFAGAWASRRIARRIMTRNLKAGDRPLCGKCRFDLSGTLAIDWQGDAKPPNLGGICPECGADVSRPGAVVKANDHFVIEALRMPVPLVLIAAGVALCGVLRPDQANYAKALPNSMLLWQVRRGVATENAQYAIIRRLRQQRDFPDTQIRELVPEALAISRRGKLADHPVWGAVLSSAAERSLLSQSELSEYLVGIFHLARDRRPGHVLIAERDREAFTPRNAMIMWCPTSVKIDGRVVLVARVNDERDVGYALLPPRFETTAAPKLEIAWRVSLWPQDPAAKNPVVISAPVASVATVSLGRHGAVRSFVDRTCYPTLSAVTALQINVADVVDRAGTTSRQVVGMQLGIGTGGFGPKGRAECAAGGALQMSLVDENDTRYPLAVAVLLLPEDEDPAIVDRFPRIYWSLQELPPAASALLRPGHRVKLRIESSEELERAYLPGGPVWRGVSEYEVDVESFGPANPDLWLSTF